MLSIIFCIEIWDEPTPNHPWTGLQTNERADCSPAAPSETVRCASNRAPAAPARETTAPLQTTDGLYENIYQKTISKGFSNLGRPSAGLAADHDPWAREHLETHS
jgi:hypothetical protein